jgi:hypothetical protein
MLPRRHALADDELSLAIPSRRQTSLAQGTPLLNNILSTSCPTELSDYPPIVSPSGVSPAECWQWPSEISSTMEWSAQFLDSAYMATHTHPFSGGHGDTSSHADGMMAPLNRGAGLH